MLPKQYRLPGSTRLISPKSFSTPHFFLKVSQNNSPYSRFGFLVRKSVDKRAIVRNRIRRVFRSCIEDMRQSLSKGKDMLFILNASLLEMKREELYNELHAFFKEKNFLE